MALPLGWPSLCDATQILRESLESVLTQTKTAVIADVMKIDAHDDGLLWRVVDFRTSVVRTIFGDPVDLPALLCRYEEGRPYTRSGVRVSPRVTGSGAEFDLMVESRVVLLLEGTPIDPKNCRILRIEPISNEAQVSMARRRLQPSKGRQ